MRGRERDKEKTKDVRVCGFSTLRPFWPVRARSNHDHVLQTSSLHILRGDGRNSGRRSCLGVSARAASLRSARFP